MPAISPFLWFDTQAEEAAKFYTSVFPHSKITATTYYGDAGPGAPGSVMTVAFELDGQRFTAINGGPHYKFTNAVSFVVDCDTQQDVDNYWSKLTEGGGEEVQCGWLHDKYGLAWQIVPKALMRMLQDPDAARTQRVMRAMFQMKKLDIAQFEAAYEEP